MLSTLIRKRIARETNAPSWCTNSVLVACPDARPPAYQAVVGLSKASLLGSFRTAAYFSEHGALTRVAQLSRLGAQLTRRYHPDIPATRVHASSWVDASLAIENRLRNLDDRRALSIWRTRKFDRELARSIVRRNPGALFAFSDVASEFAFPVCRSHGIPAILSIVCGDPREEQRILEREMVRSPEFARFYLGDGRLDRTLLRWLHERRLKELELADHILVPSPHLAETLFSYGTRRERITVVPYAADVHRFQPDPKKHHSLNCKFLFVGGITQRKGVVDLLKAWALIRRTGWKLQLLGGMPNDPGPLVSLLNQEGVEWLGRVGHAEVPSRMSAADVFVFPSLFEGSAVVTYEALASGLPCIVTAEAGSVVRDSLEGFIVPSADPNALALRMETLGLDPVLRETMSTAARSRAKSFDWPRYHEAVAAIARTMMGVAPDSPT